jgi:hypothetical protein
MAAYTVHELLSSYPPPIVSTVDRLIQCIHQVAPDAREKANRGWRSIRSRQGGQRVETDLVAGDSAGGLFRAPNAAGRW